MPAVAVLLTGGVVAGAAPVVRYGDPAVVQPRTALAVRIEQAVQAAAGQVRRSPLVVDARLEAALEVMLRSMGWGAQPNLELASQALWLQGIVDPVPHLLHLSVSEGGEADLLAKVREQAARLIAQGNYRRLGVAWRNRSARSLDVLIGLQETGLVLDPLPRELARGAEVSVTGRLLEGLSAPELLVALPAGRVVRAQTTMNGSRFVARLRCAAVGRHQVEIMAEGAHGPTVVANFPVYCGTAAPTALEADTPQPEVGRAWTVEEAERRFFELLQRDRVAAGLRSLTLDARLSDVARRHSQEMGRENYVGHVSSSTGDASARLRRAGLPVPELLLENLAMGGSPDELERGWLGSPGHRANALSPAVTHVGIGVAVGAGGVLSVTELLVRWSAGK